MSTAGTPSTDPWIIVPRERIRYEEQFRSLKPINNVITGDQAKGFFLQSQLPPPILGHIWALADTDADGKMDIDEFSIACKLINLRLRGFEIPKVVPPNLLASLQSFAQPNIIPAPNLVNVSSISNNIIQSQQPLNNFVVTAPPVMPASIVSPLSVNVMSTTNKPVPVPVPIQPPTSHISPLGTETSNTPRASITSLEKTMSIESPINDWVIPHHTKLKYTQIFNANDKTRSGFLTGVQARNIMVHTKLPQNILAQIWSLADMDCDGRLGCEEFILAMYLCEQASLGNAIPSKLPIDLIPISFRRGNRNLSISSQGSVSLEDPASTLLQSTFEDKRKENFEKGQAELERRRKTLLDQQRKEAEERERKEREEMERKEKAKQEAEKKRLEELERQMREQQEQERLKEEERKRQSEQKEAARREMERQRQLEWEKQRLLELQQQRQREQENVLKLKAKNQSLTIELSTLNEQIKDLSQKICDTRLGVSNVKTTIDGMRTTRDIHMQEQNQLKQKLKEQNNKLLALSQEKVKLDSKIKSSYRNEDDKSQINFDNKDIILRNLKEKVEDLQSEIDTKLTDIENNNTHLTDLKSQLKNLLNECESMYGIYKDKKDKVLEIKSLSRTHNYNSDWRTTDNWQTTNEKTTNWPVENDDEIIKYKALYEFVARNTDEISFQPGDIINVPKKQVGEPGWLAGEIRGHTGWFPESYVESLIDNTIDHNIITQQEIIQAARLEEITEEINEISIVSTAETILNEESNNTLEYYVANYPYQSQEQGDLTFNAGEIIQVIKKDGEWWTGKIGNTIGIFPSNYVQRTDMVANDTINDTKTIATDIMSDTITSDNMNQMDNEVSQINELRMIGKPIDQSATNTQTLKGKKPEIASVIAPYQATSAEQLSLARGQLIMIRKKTDSGWWEGELQAKGRKRQVGWFPASYVKVLNSSGRVSGRTTPVSTTRMQQDIIIDKVIALFSYTAGNPDELSFSKDDIISVTARDEEAWWKGELNGITGFFPSNYVAPLQQSH